MSIETIIKYLCFWLIIALDNCSMAAETTSVPKQVPLCSRCHGVQGNGTNPNYPKLAAQHPDYLIKQLTDFKQGKSGKRFQPEMYATTAKLADQDIIQLAYYFADLEPTEGFAKNQQLALGQKIYRGGDRLKNIPACSACHGPAGQGNAPAKFPRLAGQHAAYILKQLEKFQQGQRHNDPRKIMQDITAKMTFEDMTAVANYINGLH